MTLQTKEEAERLLNGIEHYVDDLYGTAPMQSRLIRHYVEKLKDLLKIGGRA